MMNASSATFQQLPANDTLGDEYGIRVYAIGPWQQPVEDASVLARYIIGQSKQGFHWDIEFPKENKDFSHPQISAHLKPHESEPPSLTRWSKPYTFADLAIKHARRDLNIRARMMMLDVTTKVRFNVRGAQEKYLGINEISLDKRLVYAVSHQDLQRIALYNGYLSWSEFENDTVDLSVK